MLSQRNAVVNIRSAKFLLLMAIFITIATLVESGVSAAFDQYIIVKIADARNTVTDAVIIAITTSADLFPIYFSPLIIFSLILIIKKKTRRIGSILLLVLTLTTITTTYVKDIVDRERPTYEFKPEIGFNYKPEQDVISRFASSFPSGHASRSAAFALIVSFMIRNRNVLGIPAGMLMWIFPIAVAFSRVYIGAHYPTDVIAGVVLGLIVANAVSRILKLEPEKKLYT